MPRRRILTGVATGAAAMVARPLAGLAADAPAGKKRWRMKLSTSTIQFTALPVEQAIGRIAGLGFDAVDVWSAHAGCPHLDDVAKRLGAKGLVDCCKNHGVDLYAFSVYKGGYAKYAELLGKAGGGVAVRGAAKACKPSELTAKMKQFLESLKPEIELAEKYDSFVALENHGGNILNSIDGLKAFVDNNSSKRLGIALAPYHLQGGKVSVPDAIRTVGDRLLFFYAWQRGKGVNQLPGHGPTDFKPWLAALAAINYPWPVNPFMHHEPPPDEMAAALEKSRKYLLECYKQAIT
jgi:sugar phosphate isomerase/epimerase